MKPITILLIASQLLFTATKIYSQPDEQELELILIIEFKKPIKQNAKKLIETAQKTLYHSISEGYFYILITEKELKSIFNLEVSHKIVKGAGNRTDTDAHFLKIKDKSKLDKKIQTFLKNVYIEDDPKFPVIDDAVEYDIKH